MADNFPFDQYNMGTQFTKAQINTFYKNFTDKTDITDITMDALPGLFAHPDVQGLPQGIKDLLLGLHAYMQAEKDVREKIVDPVLLTLIGKMYTMETSPNGGEPGG